MQLQVPVKDMCVNVVQGLHVEKVDEIKKDAFMQSIAVY